MSGGSLPANGLSGAAREFCRCPTLLVKNTSRRDATELSLLSSDRGDGDSHEEKASVYHWHSTSREPRSACCCCARFELRAFPSSRTNCSVCVRLRSSTGRRLVHGKRQNVTHPTSPLNIPIPRANPAQRCGVGCVEDDAHRRISERSSDQYHPSNRSPQ